MRPLTRAEQVFAAFNMGVEGAAGLGPFVAALTVTVTHLAVPQANALVTIFDGGNTLSKGYTDALGVVAFPALPAGAFTATATKAALSGTSPVVLVAGPNILPLPIV